MSLNKKQIEKLTELKGSGCIHASNMLAKKEEPGIEKFYCEYINFNNATSKKLSIAVKALNKYKNFVRKQSTFSAQSKFEPTVIEEFICQVLKTKFGNDVLRYGSVKAYSSLYFSYLSKDDFKRGVSLKLNIKDQDVGIYKRAVVQIDDEEKYNVYIPIVCIECKTYLDKTMYEGSVATASKIKIGNPQCLFFIVTETYEVTSDVDIEMTQIDDIYILRKQRRRNGNNEISLDVIEHLINRISNSLQATRISVDEMITRGHIRQ